MASLWMGVDSNFPSFKDDDSAAEKISKLLNYMYVLTEQLKYTLANLDATNWNTAALAEISEESTEPIAEEIQAIIARLAILNASISVLSARVTNVEAYGGRIAEAEETIANHTGQISQLGTRLSTAETGIVQNTAQITAIDGRVAANSAAITSHETALATQAAAILANAGTIETVRQGLQGAIGDITDLQGNVSAQGGRISSLEESMTQLANIMSGFVDFIVTSGTTVTIGGSGKNVNLLGTVKVNGTPI